MGSAPGWWRAANCCNSFLCCSREEFPHGQGARGLGVPRGFGSHPGGVPGIPGCDTRCSGWGLGRAGLRDLAVLVQEKQLCDSLLSKLHRSLGESGAGNPTIPLPAGKLWLCRALQPGARVDVSKVLTTGAGSWGLCWELPARSWVLCWELPAPTAAQLGSPGSGSTEIILCSTTHLCSRLCHRSCTKWEMLFMEILAFAFNPINKNPTFVSGMLKSLVTLKRKFLLAPVLGKITIFFFFNTQEI